MPKHNMEDALNEILFGVKPIVKKAKRKPIKESVTNVKSIFEDTADTTTQAEYQEPEPSDKDGTDQEQEKAAETTEKKVGKLIHKAKGQLVMSVSLTISDKDMGRAEIGKDEFVDFADVTSLLDLYGVNSEKLKTVDSMPTSFNLAIKDEATSDKNSIMLVYRLNENDTITTTLYVGSDEVPLDAASQNVVEAAFSEFDKQYKNAIRRPINQEIFG
jgi:hypothetical protein